MSSPKLRVDPYANGDVPGMFAQPGSTTGEADSGRSEPSGTLLGWSFIEYLLREFTKGIDNRLSQGRCRTIGATVPRRRRTKQF